MVASVDILDLADKAARCVLRGRACWAVEDWQDATQEAAAAVWLTAATHPEAGEAYLFTAAKTAIYTWLRAWLRHPRGGTFIEFIQYSAEEAASGAVLDFARIQSLTPLLTGTRITPNKATADKVQEDITFLWLLLQGYSIEGIALEMGLSRRNIYAIRERLLPRLERLARGEQTPARKQCTVRESSKAALARINQDPERLRQRGAAISAALARKKSERQARHVK